MVIASDFFLKVMLDEDGTQPLGNWVPPGGILNIEKFALTRISVMLLATMSLIFRRLYGVWFLICRAKIKLISAMILLKYAFAHRPKGENNSTQYIVSYNCYLMKCLLLALPKHAKRYITRWIVRSVEYLSRRHFLAEEVFVPSFRISSVVWFYSAGVHDSPSCLLLSWCVDIYYLFSLICFPWLVLSLWVVAPPSHLLPYLRILGSALWSWRVTSMRPRQRTLPLILLHYYTFLWCCAVRWTIFCMNGHLRLTLLLCGYLAFGTGTLQVLILCVDYAVNTLKTWEFCTGPGCAPTHSFHNTVNTDKMPLTQKFQKSDGTKKVDKLWTKSGK